MNCTAAHPKTVYVINKCTGWKGVMAFWTWSELQLGHKRNKEKLVKLKCWRLRMKRSAVIFRQIRVSYKISVGVGCCCCCNSSKGHFSRTEMEILMSERHPHFSSCGCYTCVCVCVCGCVSVWVSRHREETNYSLSLNAAQPCASANGLQTGSITQLPLSYLGSVSSL